MWNRNEILHRKPLTDGQDISVPQGGHIKTNYVTISNPNSDV
jgi:hypothetical protein